MASEIVFIRCIFIETIYSVLTQLVRMKDQRC